MKYIQNLAIILTLCILAFACKKPMNEIRETDYPRAFSPIGLNEMQGGFGEVNIVWRAIDDAFVYELQVSEGDNLQFTNIVRTIETEQTNVNLTGLLGETRYSVRVRAKSFKSGQEDSKWYGITFVTNPEQLFYNVRGDDIRTTGLTVRWTPNSEVTILYVDSDDEDVDEIGEIDITPEEKAAGVKIITGLEHSTPYRIRIYNDELLRGTVFATTKWRPSGDDVIELALTDDLRTYMQNSANIGKTLLLPEGYVFTTENDIAIAGSMHIYGDPDGDPVVIYVNKGSGLFQFPTSSGAVIDFENITIENIVPDANTAHVFTVNGAFNVARVMFKNCRIANFGRGVNRLQGTTIIDEYIFDDCILEDIGNKEGNYATFDIEGNSAVKYILFRNSTINGHGGPFIRYHDTYRGPVPTDSIRLENVTFYNALTRPTQAGAQWFIRTENPTATPNPIPGGTRVIMSNVILGSTGPSTMDAYNGHTEYANSGGTLILDNVWRTNDWRQLTNVDGVVQNAFPEGLNPAGNAPALVQNFNGGAADVFVDPTAGNFRVKATGAISNAGDPRWR
ncbi:MAG: DUF5123 domain-containing protein [Bacteroidales bacterium]|nr:DUF5123 domain-containing protein [Bacteroidales bacterium]